MKKLLKSVYNYFVFFVMIAFVITCCMLLFVSTMSETLNIELTGKNLSTAAKLTFGNVIFLSALYTISDAIRRKITVERHVKRIIRAAEQITQGDFSVRIEPVGGMDAEYQFNRIIACFNKMAEELSGTETLRTDFIANVSHELKTPLAVMQNYSTMLQSPALTDEERLQYARAVSDSARKLSDLISNILKLNKLENQQIYPEKRLYNLGEQLCECLLSFENAWENKNLEIETHIEEDVLVETDSEMMSLVWNNLFSNAIKFTPEGGRISLKLTSENDWAVVSVTDTGCGISREVGERMFDKFYQGDTSHATAGNGLGLALVKRVLDITDSSITVESELGCGSTFAVKMRRIINGNTKKDID